MLACTSATSTPATMPNSRASHDRAGERPGPTAAANAPASIIALERDVDRARLLGDQLARRGEQQHDGGDRGVAVRALVGGDLAERGEEVTASRPRRPAASLDGLDRRHHQRLGRWWRRARGGARGCRGRGRQQQRQHEQALHDVGDAARHAGGAQEAGAGAQAAEDERDEDRDQHALAGDERREQAGEADAGAEVGDELVVAEVAAGEHDAAGETGEAARDEHRRTARSGARRRRRAAPCRGCGRASAAGSRPPYG